MQVFGMVETVGQTMRLPRLRHLHLHDATCGKCVLWPARPYLHPDGCGTRSLE
jgi:hypothetical protein